MAHVSGPAVGEVIFRGVWKRFRTGRQHASLRDLLTNWTSRRTPNEQHGASASEFWALRDVTLDVRAGEALGIIGPNGAGKSTILKLLTGILRPNIGEVAVSGRIGALIELAAGFHPDLTGRENVYLQGAIMGMRRSEVARRFDEIVAFAGVESFIDTPVKRYSNGMNARLGFSIAAHLDPDLLLIDEVLAVGDRAFQRKAIDYVNVTLSRGVPVVLVTHQLQLVSELCSRAVLLVGGEVVCSGSAEQCVNRYVSGGDEMLPPSPSDAPLRVLDLSVEPADHVASGEAVTVVARAEVTGPEAGSRAAIALRVRSLPSEELLFFTSTARAGLTLPASGTFAVEFSLKLHLAAGFYRLETCIVDLERAVEWSRGASATIRVAASELFGGRVFLDPRVRLVDST